MPPKINCLPTTHIHTHRERARIPPLYWAPLVLDMRRRPSSLFAHERNRFPTGSVFIVTVFCLVLVFFVSRLLLGLFVCAVVLFVLFLVRVWCCAFWCARWFRVFSFRPSFDFRVFSFMVRVWGCDFLRARMFRVSFYWCAFWYCVFF